jgi:archaeosortase A (PGF-CTERM-specific)
MISLLWASLILLVIASVLPKGYNSRFVIGGLGWIFLSVYLFFLPQAYLKIEDYLNAFLAVAAGIVSIFIAYIVFQSGNRKDDEHEVFFSLARAASVGGLIYFLFAEVEFLNTGIISAVTDQVVWMLGKFGSPVEQVAWNQFAVNGSVVEIILACTAIESIALFSGIISSAAGAPATRKLLAFMISVPVLYFLNLIRVSFTASAYGLSWFGMPDESFHISEHFITKIGSLLALFVISYFVLKTLPEVLEMLDGVLKMIRIEFHRLMVR